MDKKCKNCIFAIVILIVLVLVIGLYGGVMRLLFKDNIIFKDFMNIRVFNMGENCCSLWPISHFILYMILAFLFPNCITILFLIGVMWEFIEMTGDNVISRFNTAKHSGNTQYSSNWVEGNFKDVVFNSAGLAVGYALRKLYDKKEEEKKKKKKKKKITNK